MFSLDFSGVGKNLYGASSSKPNTTSTSSAWSRVSNIRGRFEKANQIATETLNSLPTEIKPFPGISVPKLDLDLGGLRGLSNFKDKEEPKTTSSSWNPLSSRISSARNAMKQATEMFNALSTEIKPEPVQIIEDIKPDKPGRNKPKPNKPGQNKPKPIKPVKTEPLTVLQVPNITDIRGSPLTKNVSNEASPNNTMLYIAGAVGSVGVIGLGMYFMKSN